MHARACSAGADRPHCGGASDRVYGRHMRRLADAAVSGTSVVIELLVRRFKCPNPACRAVTLRVATLIGRKLRANAVGRVPRPTRQPGAGVSGRVRW
ncbi:transposase family protein [Kitasatospora sp. NPDC057542]|uniref:transposase family protein n=1 Tax=Kitasatospora sp. NPDC057542 TaxID=3346162 RepID=UPI0036B03602